MTNRRMDEIIRHQHPVTMPTTATVRDACGEMHRRRIGAVLVTDAKGGLAGIFTGRDLVRIVAGGKDPGATTLRSAMTAQTAHDAAGPPRDRRLAGDARWWLPSYPGR